MIPHSLRDRLGRGRSFPFAGTAFRLTAAARQSSTGYGGMAQNASGVTFSFPNVLVWLLGACTSPQARSAVSRDQRSWGAIRL